MIAPRFAAMLARVELARLLVEGLKGGADFLRVAAAHQLGDELHLALAGDMGADTARLLDLSPQLLVQRHPRQLRPGQIDQPRGQGPDFEGVAAPLRFADFVRRVAGRMASFDVLSDHIRPEGSFR